MSEKVKAIRGSNKREQDVKNWLKEQGAKDSSLNKIFCDSKNTLFFVKLNGDVDYVQDESFFFLFDIEELPLWRANYREIYWYISDSGKALDSPDLYNIKDDDRYKMGNYFKTELEAEEFCPKIVKLLRERK